MIINDDHLDELSADRLLSEFNRLADLKAQCEISMRAIRQEQARRKDALIAEMEARQDTDATR